MAEGTVTEGWLHDTLEQLIAQIRTLLDVTGVAFVTIDEERAAIRPAAAWFISNDASRAFTPLLDRPYDPERGGVTEAAVESGTAVLIPRISEWPGAEGLRDRLSEHLDDQLAQVAWDFYATASFISAPVRTAGGRTFGVLAISSNPPLRPLNAEDLRSVEVFARLAALALERSELLEREVGLRREEGLLNRALQAVAASIDLEAIYRAIVEHAGELSGASSVLLTRYDAGQRELRHVAGSHVSERLARARFRLGEGMLGRVAASGQPYVSAPEDQERFVRWVIETEGIGSFMHVPIMLGGRLFGVLSATHTIEGRFGEDDLRRLAAFGVGAAGAIAHGLEFEHERRIARALTAGFVPGPPDPMTGLELGLVYEPVAHEVGGGDVFGVWTLPSGAVAVLIGDVSGKGLEVAAASAMVRFFVEARAWDTESPAEVLAQANRILRTRLRRGGFATAFLAVVQDGRVRYCNAGHPPPCLLRADGSSQPLPGSGLPLGIEADGQHEEREVAMELGDVLFAATDGLLETRRAGEFFGDDRLLGAAVGARPHDAAAAARRARVRRRAGVGAGAPRRRRRARAAARARGRAARRAGERPGRAGAVRRVPGARARAARAGVRAERGDLRERADVRRAALGLRRPLRARAPGGVRRAALAGAGAGRDQAHVRDRGRAQARARAAPAGRARAAGRRPGRAPGAPAHDRRADRGAGALRLLRLRRGRGDGGGRPP